MLVLLGTSHTSPSIGTTKTRALAAAEALSAAQSNANANGVTFDYYASASPPACGFTIEPHAHGKASLEVGLAHSEEGHHSQKPLHARRNTVVRIAVVMYGMVRHRCTRLTFQKAWVDPIRKHVAAMSGAGAGGVSDTAHTRHHSAGRYYTFHLDVFVNANVLRDPPNARTLSKINSFALDKATWWGEYRPCIAEFVYQDSFAADVEQAVDQTCGVYGQDWDTPSGKPAAPADCAYTTNYFRALHSQERAAALIQRHEERTDTRYDVIANARIDVLFTHAVPVDLYHLLLDAKPHLGSAVAEGHPMNSHEHGRVLVPRWAAWDGVNDRFQMGTRNATLEVMRRRGIAREYCASNKVGFHAEKFLKWFFLDHHRDLSVIYTERLGFRRVRETGKMVAVQEGLALYPPLGDERTAIRHAPGGGCALDSLRGCFAQDKDIADLPVCAPFVIA